MSQEKEGKETVTEWANSRGTIWQNMKNTGNRVTDHMALHP
jgi:hypothetical protein